MSAEIVCCIFAKSSAWTYFVHIWTQNIKCSVQKFAVWDTTLNHLTARLMGIAIFHLFHICSVTVQVSLGDIHDSDHESKPYHVPAKVEMNGSQRRCVMDSSNRFQFKSSYLTYFSWWPWMQAAAKPVSWILQASGKHAPRCVWHPSGLHPALASPPKSRHISAHRNQDHRLCLRKAQKKDCTTLKKKKNPTIYSCS